jgi:hypothetical protein
MTRQFFIVHVRGGMVTELVILLSHLRLRKRGD